MDQKFAQKVYGIVKNIPKGKVATYQDIAILAGSPSASRAVGTAMKNNPDMKMIPCHRVIGSDGKMHGYAFGSGIKTKKERLENEGVVFKGEKVVFEKSHWQPLV